MGATVFVCLFASAVAGVLVHARLPRQMLPPGVARFLRRGVALVAAMAALLMVLMTVSLKNSFDTADRDVKRFSAQLIELDRTLRRIGPDAVPARELLFRYTARAMQDTWPRSRSGLHPRPTTAPSLVNELEDSILQLPADRPQRQLLVAEAQRLLQDSTTSRWAVQAHTGGSLSPWLLAVVLFWLMLTFGSFGLSAPMGEQGGRTVTMVSLFLFSVALSGGVFLLREYDDPFSGVITVSHEPLQNALFEMGE